MAKKAAKKPAEKAVKKASAKRVRPRTSKKSALAGGIVGSKADDRGGTIITTKWKDETDV